jgi:hypothetical protein
LNARPGSRRAATLALVAFSLLCVLVAFRDTLFGTAILAPTGDLVRQGPHPEALRAVATERARNFTDVRDDFLPWLRYAADQRAATGSVPLWKDTAICGAPFLGAAQPALLFPTQAAMIAAGSPPRGHGVVAAVETLLALLFAASLARHLGISLLGAMLAGATFAFGGFCTLYLQFPLMNAALLLPLLLLLGDRVVLAPGGGRIALLAVAAAVQHLGGHPETTFHVQVGVAIAALARVLASRLPLALAVRRVAAVALGFTLGAALAAVVLVPFLEYLWQSDVLARRSSGEIHSAAPLSAAGGFLLVALLGWSASSRCLRDAAGARSILLAGFGATAAFTAALIARRIGAGPAQPLTLLAADWFGGPDEAGGLAAYVIYGQPFLGPALALAIAGSVLGERRRLASGLAAVMVVTLFLGYESPLLTPLLHAIPPFDVAVNSRLLLFTLLAGALLAGLGLDSIRDRATRGGLRYALALLSIVLAPLAAAGFDAYSARSLPPPYDGILREAGDLDAIVIGERARDVGGDRTVLAGALALDVAPREALLAAAVVGDAVVPATLRAVDRSALPPGFATPGTSEPLYAFAIELPLDAAARGAPVRLLVRGAGGAAWLSAPLDDASPIARWRWLVSTLAPRSPTAWRQLAWLAGVALGILFLRFVRHSWRSLGRAALLGVAVLGIVDFARGIHPRVPLAAYYPRSSVHDFLIREGAGERFHSGGLFSPEISSFHGIADVLGYDAMYPARTAALLRRAIPHPGGGSPRIEQLGAGLPDARLLGMMGVRHFVRRDPARGEAAFRGDHGYFVTRNEHHLPRVRLVARAVVEPDDEAALARLADPSFDLATTVILASGDALGSDDDGPPGEATVRRSDPDRLVFDVAPRRDAYLVLADTHFPGWKAFVDGGEREILRANVAFRAVRLERGDAQVEFRYQPASVAIGLWITGAATAILLALALLAWRGRGR